ncbi:oligosaccharide flippase family protein [Shinella sp. CPCC 100929]|uniref:Oligosaccharide flippase family protein n=2 Tax=Shinella lacus TaxID=2654216 RepID=A0ABT1R069_9HYPH|nr:oligosaccharide flippase family protein [Shinella lacus]
MQLVIQFGYFMLLSRYLGPSDYGVFVTLSAINGIGVLLIGLGSDHVMIQRVAVDPGNFPRYLGHSVAMSALTMPVVAVFAIAISHYLVSAHIALSSLLAFVAAHLVFGRIVAVCASAFMAFDRAKLQMLVNVGMAVLRALFLVAAVVLQKDLTLDHWAWWYLAASALGALISVVLVAVVCGMPSPAVIRGDISLGLQYCLEFVAIGSVADVDKPAVAQTLGPDIAGQYAAGFKIVDAASAPIRALLYATYTRHFRNASASAAESVRFGLKLVPFSLLISVPIAIFLYFVADYIPYLIGHDFDGTPEIIQLLALYPLLMGLSGIGADILRAVGKQKLRITLLIITALVMVPAIWAGAVLGGLLGAGLARLIVQISLVGATWLFLARDKTV